MSMTTGIYKITNKINGVKYGGIREAARFLNMNHLNSNSFPNYRYI